jgi:hypothetical protein
VTTAAAATTFTPLAEIVINPETALVHEHGWQSWSPTTTYRVGEGPHRPSSDRRRVIARKWYVAIWTLMVVSMVSIGLAYWLVSDWRHGVLWIEAVAEAT